jgi:hypothetical protein
VLSAIALCTLGDRLELLAEGCMCSQRQLNVRRRRRGISHTLQQLDAYIIEACGFAEVRFCDVSTPEQKCIGSPEQKYINDVGKKPPELGAFRQASGLVGMIRRSVRAGMA